MYDAWNTNKIFIMKLFSSQTAILQKFLIQIRRNYQCGKKFIATPLHSENPDHNVLCSIGTVMHYILVINVPVNILLKMAFLYFCDLRLGLFCFYHVYIEYILR